MKYIKTKIENKILLLTIDRVDKLNALNSTMLDELDSTLSSYYDNNDINVIIINGAGNKSFVAGADIFEMQNFSKSEASIYSSKGINLFNKMESFSKPIIASIDGYALGGGCELAMACHFRYASSNSMFGLPEVSLGLIPGFGGTQRLRNIVGIGNACELILSGKYIDSNEAYRIGLINKVCENVLEETMSIAKKISKNSPLAIKNALKSIVSGMNSNYFDSFDIENNYFSSLFGSFDAKEGMDAFLNKRKSKFKGK